MAGAALAGLVVPQGMAYAGIAGVRPEMGLYAASAGMLVYAFFGTSRNAQQVHGLLISRPNGILFFANANRIRSRLRDLVKQSDSPIKTIVLNLEASPEVGVTGLEMLQELTDELYHSGITVCFTRVADPVRDLFLHSGFLERLGQQRIFSRTDAAVDAFLATTQLKGRASIT
jgi:MFS superfamily sulfate permease-like transporter